MAKLILVEHDPNLIAENVRVTRMMLRMRQEELAVLSDLSLRTIRRIESGIPTSRGTLSKVCKGLDVTFHQLTSSPTNVVGSQIPYGIHHREENIWYYPNTVARPKIPSDEAERIQDPNERRRLGKLGLVPMFACSSSFLMPEGPGVLQMELFGRLEEVFNADVYRMAVIYCVRGEIELFVRDEIISIGEGDLFGYETKDMRWMQPAEGQDLPAAILWIGAIRVGSIPRSEGQRIKRRKVAVSE